MKILIVDDDQVTRKRIASTLKKENHEVVECSNGNEALEVLNQEDPPRLIVVDWMMPEMDGLTLCKKIRTGSNLLSTYIIMLSSKSDGNEVHEGFKAGVNDYVRKPFSTIELKARINVGIQVLELQAVVNQQNTQLFKSCKLATIGEMAANIAHEVNNPLTVIDGFTQRANQLLDMDPLPIDKIKHCHNKVINTSARINKITKNLLNLSRNSSDRFDEIKISSLIETSIDLCRDNLMRAGIELEVDPYDKNISIEGKESNLSQVLINLISNAQQAIINHEEKWIRLTILEASESITFKITDSGKGIEQDIKNKLMEPFFTTKENGKGTGLGLSISKSIIQDHVGDFYIDETTPNTCFAFSIPKKQIGGSLKTRHSIKVLIVEDEEGIRELLSEEVRNTGVKVLLAADGSEALELLKENEVDIILSDINMPRMDGVQLMSALQEKYEHEEKGTLPLLLFMTGYGRNALHPEKLNSLGVQGLFEKTNVAVQIKKVISRYCRVGKTSLIAA